MNARCLESTGIFVFEFCVFYSIMLNGGSVATEITHVVLGLWHSMSFLSESKQ